MRLSMRMAGMVAIVIASMSWMAGCAREVKPEITAGVDVCSECNMIIDQVNQGCGYVVVNEFVPFDSPGCLLRSIESLREEGRSPPDGIYFADYGDASFHPADSTTFLLTSHIPTVMNAQVICFCDREDAEDRRTNPDEIVTDWRGYQTRRGTPDTVLNVTFAPDGMEPETVEVEKGALVLWRIVGRGLKQDLVVTIKGYPEVGSFTVPESGEEVELRLIAIRPGAGFPFIPTDGGDPLGMMKVTGAHTLDEEEM